jgi:hypothetical protein
VIEIADQSCQIIPDSAVELLCLLALCLRIACGQREVLAPLALAAAVNRSQLNPD